jgi:hypothetical protein
MVVKTAIFSRLSDLGTFRTNGRTGPTTSLEMPAFSIPFLRKSTASLLYQQQENGSSSPGKKKTSPVNKVRLALVVGVACVVISTAAALGLLLTPSEGVVSILDPSVEVQEGATRVDSMELVSAGYSNLVVDSWYCMQDCQSSGAASLFVQLYQGGIVCAADNSYSTSCKWYPRSRNCDGLRKPRSANTRRCTGYSGLHWCNEASTQLKLGKSLCGQRLLAPIASSTTTTVIPTTTKTVVAPALKTYPTLPAEASKRDVIGFSVQGQDMDVQIERIEDRGSVIRISWVRFAIRGPGMVECRLEIAQGGDFRIGPKIRVAKPGKDYPFELRGNVLMFSLPEPGQYYVKLDEDSERYSPTFLIIIDDWKVQPSGINVKSYSSIQAAIDGAPSRSTLIFPPGIHRTGSLRISRSHINLYFAPGSVLVSNNAGSDSYFIQISGTNVTLQGPGIIDAKLNHNNIIQLREANGVTLKQIFFRNAGSWAMHLATSRNIFLDGIVTTSARDVWDPDASTDVVIQNSFGMGIDDLFAVKCRYQGLQSSRITLRNNAGVSVKSALKVGTESGCSFSDITFDTNDVLDGERGIVVSYVDGGSMDRITFKNTRLFMTYWPAESRSGTIVEFCKYCSANSYTGRSPTPSRIQDIVVDGLWANVFYRSICDASLQFPVKISMRNIDLIMEKPIRSPRYAFSASEVNNRYCTITATNVKIGWQGNKNAWSGLADGSWFQFVNLVETIGSLPISQF